VTERSLLPVADPQRALVAGSIEVTQAFHRVIASGRYVHGEEHAAFENELAQYVGVRHCIGVACGTDALELALHAVGCQPGDEVLTAANCGAYASVAARNAGLRPRYADVDPETLCLSPSTIQAALGPGVRAAVVTHLYGRIADIDSIVTVCHERGIAVVEDCAQAIGARWKGRRAGSFGDAAAFSFYPTKNLAAVGDGGAVTTDVPKVADTVRRLRQYGWGEKYSITMPGGRNSRLDELQAAILRARLHHLDEHNDRRRRIVGQYAAALTPSAGRFVASPGADFVGHLAVLLAASDRAELRASLAEAGIGTDIHYPIADHRQPAWQDEYSQVRLPVTEDVVGRVLTVPCFPELTDDEVSWICEVLRAL
jgi:dTDP-4-amino-4,6-dideoxygalactose transaminase